MVKLIKDKDKKLFQCKECGLLYKEKNWAERRKEWCRKNHTCNLKIIKHAEKNERN